MTNRNPATDFARMHASLVAELSNVCRPAAHVRTSMMGETDCMSSYRSGTVDIVTRLLGDVSNVDGLARIFAPMYPVRPARRPRMLLNRCDYRVRTHADRCIGGNA